MIDVLESIKHNFGVDILRDPPKVISLVTELQPYDKKILRRVTMFYDSGAATEIINNIDSPQLAFAGAVSKYCDYADASQEVAEEIIVSFFRVLEIDLTFINNKTKNNNSPSFAKTNEGQTEDDILFTETESEIQLSDLDLVHLRREIVELSAELKNISEQCHSAKKELQNLGVFSFKRNRLSAKLSDLWIYKEELESKVKEKKRQYAIAMKSDNSINHDGFNTTANTHVQSADSNHIDQTTNNNKIPTNDKTARTISSIVQIVRSMQTLARQEVSRESFSNLNVIKETRKELAEDEKTYINQMDSIISNSISGFITNLFTEVSKALERCDHNDCRYHWIAFCVYKQFLPYISDYIDETQIQDAYETAMNLAPDYLKYRFRKEQTRNDPDFEFLIFNQEKLKREYENAK